MHSKSDKTEFIVYDNGDAVIGELFESLLNRYQIIFDCVHFLYYKFHKTNQNRNGSYIDSSDWMKNNKSNQ